MIIRIIAYHDNDLHPDQDYPKQIQVAHNNKWDGSQAISVQVSDILYLNFSQFWFWWESPQHSYFTSGWW